MKYCQHCGNEVVDDAVICPKCGCSVANNSDANKTNGFAIAGFVCSFFIPILGFVFGGIGLSKSKALNGKGKNFSIAALAISGAFVLLGLISVIASAVAR